MPPSPGQRAPCDLPAPGPALPHLCPWPQSWSGRIHTITPHPALPLCRWGRSLPPPCMSWRARVSCAHPAPAPRPTPTHTLLSAVPPRLGWRTGRPQPPGPTVALHACCQEQTGSLGPVSPPAGCLGSSRYRYSFKPQRGERSAPMGQKSRVRDGSPDSLWVFSFLY